MQDSEDTWESDLDSEAEIQELMQLDISEDAAHTGKQEYLKSCTDQKIVPVAMFIAKLECEHINLRHHGAPTCVRCPPRQAPGTDSLTRSG